MRRMNDEIRMTNDEGSRHGIFSSFVICRAPLTFIFTHHHTHTLHG